MSRRWMLTGPRARCACTCLFTIPVGDLIRNNGNVEVKRRTSEDPGRAFGLVTENQVVHMVGTDVGKARVSVC